MHKISTDILVTEVLPQIYLKFGFACLTNHAILQKHRIFQSTTTDKDTVIKPLMQSLRHYNTGECATFSTR